MPKKNSLFGRINSLFRQNFSLFDSVGNSIKEANHYRWLGRCIRANRVQNRENSLYFPWITGNRAVENSSHVTAPTASAYHIDIEGFSVPALSRNCGLYSVPWADSLGGGVGVRPGACDERAAPVAKVSYGIVGGTPTGVMTRRRWPGWPLVFAIEPELVSRKGGAASCLRRCPKLS